MNRTTPLLFAALPLLLLIGSAGCSDQKSAASTAVATKNETDGTSAIVFRDVAAEAGLDYKWDYPGKPIGNILDLIGNGCAFVDYDNDGNLDILLVGPKVALYRGDGAGKFTNVSDSTGMAALKGRFLGCATGDFNNDGFTDIYITAYRGGALLQNEQGKRFRDVTVASGVATQPWATSAAFADLDGDGNLDLYIGNYVKFGPETDPQLCVQKGMKTACAPRQYDPEPGFLYKGDGTGKFTDITQTSGFHTLSGKALGVAIADYDGSGRLSVSVANDEMPGDLMKNHGNGTFENVAKLAGTATDNEGNLHGGMGTDWGDVDNDGLLDLFVATYQNEVKTLYLNDGDDLFTDKAIPLGLNSASPMVAFGMRFVDFDNDGYLDIALANGHVQDNIGQIDPRTSFKQKTLFYRGIEGKSFTDVTASLDKNVTREIMGRGLAAGDYDNDGKVDLLIVDSDGAPLLLHNETTNTGHFLGVALPPSAKSYGAMLTLKIGDKTLVRHCHTDGSYMSASDARVVFGLGNATRIDSLTVRWAGGGEDTFTDLPIDRYSTVSPTKQ
ncbi:MAG: hypothetical protein OHK0029_09760 [Armatimonadaceae bacterium]